MENYVICFSEVKGRGEAPIIKPEAERNVRKALFLEISFSHRKLLNCTETSSIIMLKATIT